MARSGFKGFSGFGFAQAMMAAAFAAAFIKPSKTKSVERRQGSRLNITRDGWKVNCHQSEVDRRSSLRFFIAQYNDNAMNFLPGRITCKLMKLPEVQMSRAASAELVELKKQNFNMRTSTW